MQPTSIGSAAQHRSIGSGDQPPGSSPQGLAAFVALLTLPFLVVGYPLIAAGLLIAGVAVAVLSRSLVDHVRRHRGRVRRVTLPGLGTVEYRFTRA